VRDRQRRRDTFRGKPLPKGYSGRGGQRAGERHRGSHGGVGAEPALVRGAVQVDHGLIRLGQRGPSPAAQQVADFGVDGRYRSEDSFALVPVRVAIAAFHRLPRARRSAGWDPGPGGRAVRQPNGYRERGPSARVQDLQRGQIRDIESRHLVSPVWRRPGSAAARPVVSSGADHLAVRDRGGSDLWPYSAADRSVIPDAVVRARALNRGCSAHGTGPIVTSASRLVKDGPSSRTVLHRCAEGAGGLPQRRQVRRNRDPNAAPAAVHRAIKYAESLVRPTRDLRLSSGPRLMGSGIVELIARSGRGVDALCPWAVDPD
jgi:hypothetical protein